VTTPITDDIEWFRALLAASEQVENPDPTAVRMWLEQRRAECARKYEVRGVGLAQLSNWRRDETSGDLSPVGHGPEVIGVEVISRVEQPAVRVGQPMLYDPDVRLVVLLAELRGRELRFLIRARTEPGRQDVLELGPTVDHGLARFERSRVDTPATPALLGEVAARCVYWTEHHRDARWHRHGRIRRELWMLEEGAPTPSFDPDWFVWVSYRQLRALALTGGDLSPSLLSILAPL